MPLLVFKPYFYILIQCEITIIENGKHFYPYC